MHYIALVDGEDGAYGVTFPDLLGCTAMGDTIDSALANATDAVKDWVEAKGAMGAEIPAARSVTELCEGEPGFREAINGAAMLATVILIAKSGRMVKVNMSLDSGVLTMLDAAAVRLKITRSALVTRLAIEKLSEYT
jgi:predicted RNase H-like HicB family nuclease